MFQISAALRSAADSNPEAAEQRANAAQAVAAELEPAVGGFATVVAGTYSVTIDIDSPDSSQLNIVVDAYSDQVEGWNEDEAGTNAPGATVTAGETVTLEMSEDSNFEILPSSMPAVEELAEQGGSAEPAQFQGVEVTGVVDSVRSFAEPVPAALEPLSYPGTPVVVAHAGDIYEPLGTGLS
ncbi:hypothetical protein [Corynebacterium doosanense]|nr:hypothetical protein [Corynebacterium doosanense]